MNKQKDGPEFANESGVLGGLRLRSDEPCGRLLEPVIFTGVPPGPVGDPRRRKEFVMSPSRNVGRRGIAIRRSSRTGTSGAGFAAVAILTFVAVAFSAPGARAGSGTCDGQGDATLERIGAVPATIGNTLDFELRGRALAPVSVIADLGPGPITIPRIGTFCVDRGPRLRILFDGIRNGGVFTDANGLFAFQVPIPRRPALAGKTVYMHGIIRDDLAPNGFAISNLASFEVLPAIVEDFTTVDRRDEAVTTAMWEGTGSLIGTVASMPREVDYLTGASLFNLPHPLVEAGNPATPNGCRFQMRFVPGQIGAVPGESIIGMSWAPKSGTVLASTYRDMTIKLGNGEAGRALVGRFDENYASEPTVVYQGDYSLALDFNAVWVPWPAFATDFAHDATKPLVFEVDFPAGGDTFQLFKNRSAATFPRNRIFADGGASNSTNGREDTTYETRFLLFQDRSFAQSDFIDSFRVDPDWSPGQIDFVSLPDGTRIVVEYEGAEDHDGNGIPELSTRTGFSTDIDTIDGSQFVRFKITLFGNRANGAIVEIGRITIPYE